MKNLLSLLIGLIIGAFISYYFFCSSGITAPPLTTVPAGLISPSEARNLSDNWTTYRKAANDSVAYGGKDNRSSWYSIEDMEYYVNYAKDSLDANGIRLYLGVNTSTFDDGGLTTIFMVPTKSGARPASPPKDISTANALDMGTNGMPPEQDYPN